MHRTLVTTVLSAAALAAAAPASAEKLDELLTANRHAMVFAEGALSGEGARFLKEEADRAEMFLVGESHGNRETPDLTRALLPDLHEAGYRAFAIETGPITAELLTELAKDPAGDAAFESFLEEHPLTFPFFWWREEAQLLREAMAQGYQAWGLDQEFIASARFLLTELAGQLEGAQRERALGWLAEAEAGFTRFTETGDQTAGFLQNVDPEDLRTFAATLADGGESREILEELAASAVVYQHFKERRFFHNNRDRIELMKRHFVDYLEGAGGIGEAPKVLMKFGSAHMGRGYSPFDQLDLGNQAAELSFARGGDSFHLLVAAAEMVTPDGSRVPTSEGGGYLTPLLPHRAGDGWTVFDLRPLRPYLSAKSVREKYPELTRIAFAFDALAVAPAFHPADAMVPLPFG